LRLLAFDCALRRLPREALWACWRTQAVGVCPVTGDSGWQLAV